MESDMGTTFVTMSMEGLHCRFCSLSSFDRLLGVHSTLTPTL